MAGKACTSSFKQLAERQNCNSLSVVSGAAKKVKLLNAFEPVGLRYQILPMTGLKALPALELRRQAELLAGSRARLAPPYSEAVLQCAAALVGRRLCFLVLSGWAGLARKSAEGSVALGMLGLWKVLCAPCGGACDACACACVESMPPQERPGLQRTQC